MSKKPKVDRCKLMAKIADEWKNLPLPQKQDYLKQAEEKSRIYKILKKQKYSKDLKKSMQEHEEGFGVVKKNRSAYNYYMKDTLKKKFDAANEKNEKVDRLEIFKQVSQNWGKLTQEDMVIWNQKSEDDFERYADEVEAYISQQQNMDNIPIFENNQPSNFGFKPSYILPEDKQLDIDDGFNPDEMNIDDDDQKLEDLFDPTEGGEMEDRDMLPDNLSQFEVPARVIHHDQDSSTQSKTHKGSDSKDNNSAANLPESLRDDESDIVV